MQRHSQNPITQDNYACTVQRPVSSIIESHLQIAARGCAHPRTENTQQHHINPQHLSVLSGWMFFSKFEVFVAAAQSELPVTAACV